MDHRQSLAEREVACTGCGYSLKGLRQKRCPECGRAYDWQDVSGPEVRISWRTAAVDLLGLGVTIGFNVLVLLVWAVLVLQHRRFSWFTEDRWNMFGRRGPQSVSGYLLLLLALSVMAWGWAWEESDVDSWRLQNALAVWCWVLTVVHVLGCLSLL